jgi:hypothetical protein
MGGLFSDRRSDRSGDDRMQCRIAELNVVQSGFGTVKRRADHAPNLFWPAR